MNKILISSAGIGSRVENYSKHLNKSLITVGRKPAIAHIIDNIPDTFDEIVITVGHKKEYIKQFLKLAYPNKNINIIDVENFEGEGSGLGHSILLAKDHLQCPFVFMPNDAIVSDIIKLPDVNYLGYSDDVESSFEYRTIDISLNESKVIDLFKKSSNNETNNVYIGIAGINDYLEFWNELENGKNDGSLEQGESFAINKMLSNNIDFNATKFDWFDTGNASSYINTNKHFLTDDKINILPKDDECIWFLNNKAVKFHIDESFISNRVKRSTALDSFVPTIEASTANMYTYEMAKGDTFSYNLTYDKFSSFLKWLPGLWTPTKCEMDFKKVCKEFYYDKTHERVILYFSKFKIKDRSEYINGKQYPNISTILEGVDWDELSECTPTNFHGDLHFENIIVNGQDDFKLIDWRQGFGKSINSGDLYYDLAKLYHGIIMSHELVDKELYSFSADEQNITFDFHRKNILVGFIEMFEKFIIDNGYDVKRVKILTALIFLNVAALHHNTYCHVLFYLGKTMLFDTLEVQ